MLLLAGILFGLALLFWFVSNWIEYTSVDLARPAWVLTILSAALVVLDLCL